MTSPTRAKTGTNLRDGDKSKGKEKPEDEETIEDVVNTMNEKQKKGHVRSDCCCRGAGERQRRG